MKPIPVDGCHESSLAQNGLVFQWQPTRLTLVRPNKQKLILLPSENKKRGWTSQYRDHPDPLNFAGYVRVNLALADSEHLGAAYRACALSCRPAVFHGYILGPLNLPLGLALHTVTLHSLPPS